MNLRHQRIGDELLDMHKGLGFESDTLTHHADAINMEFIIQDKYCKWAFVWSLTHLVHGQFFYC